MGNCQTGEVRLQGGPNVREGRVEICINNAWGTVCNNLFGVDDAIVTCTQMNFSSEGIAYISHCDYMLRVSLNVGARVVRDASLPGLSGTPIFLSGLRCNSDIHTNILDCEALDHGITRCLHDEDVVVHCEGEEVCSYEL